MGHDERFDVVVIGAGLAGLAAAATAAKTGSRVAVLDARSPGGRARTDERAGFRFNQGPHALYNGSPARAVLGRLGIRPTGGPPALTGALAWRDGELFALPGSAVGLLRTDLLGARAKAQVAKFLGVLPGVRTDRLAMISASDWLVGSGMRPDALELVATLTRVATYASDLNVLSADAACRQLQLAVRKGVSYLDGGWQTLVDALAVAATSAGAALLAGQPAKLIEPVADGWVVHTDSREIASTAVIVAVGSPAATAAILPVDPAWNLGPDLTASCLDLGLRAVPPRPVIFGVGTPLYLSTHCPPADLTANGGAVVHVMRYGARTSDEDRPELRDLAARAGITDDDIVFSRFLHRMVVAYGVPRPGAGLAGRPAVTVPDRPGVFIAGDWVGPIGMLADASLASGEAAAQAALEQRRDAALTTS